MKEKCSMTYLRKKTKEAKSKKKNSTTPPPHNVLRRRVCIVQVDWHTHILERMRLGSIHFTLALAKAFLEGET